MLLDFICLLLFTSAFSSALQPKAPYSMQAAARFFKLPSQSLVQLVDDYTLKFTNKIGQPLNLYTQQPLDITALQGDELYHFSVSLPVKERRTAIGFCFGVPEDNYLTPQYVRHNNFISMGGAGYIYPMTKNCGKGYGEGDKVSCSILPSERRVIFAVNDVNVFETILLPHINIDHIYPSISSEGGVVEAKVYLDRIRYK